MSELSKQALKVENNTNFPNNNNGQITPSDLRAFNVDMIDSTVNQTIYTSDSASWNQQIDALEQFTSSQQPSFTELNAFTASQLVINSGVNSFTQSANGRLTALESETANIEAFTASVNQIADNGVVQGTSTRLHFYGLVSASIVPNVNGAIASILIEQDPSKVGTASFNAFTQSTDISINALNAFTSSVAPTSTGSLLVTASVNLNTITFTKGDGSTFPITVDTGSGGGTVPAGTISGSAQITALGFVSSSITGSSLITASFDNGTRNLTFTKGDASTFAVNIPDVSGSAGDFVTTASFNAYTQSNDQRVGSLETNSASVNTSITNINTFSASALVSINALNVFTASQSTASLVTSIDNLNTFSASALTSISNLNLATASLNTSASLALVTASFNNGTRNLTFTKGDASTFDVNIPGVSGSTIDTGSFATTGSNTFYGSNTFNNSPSDEFRVNWGNASSASMYTETSGGPSQTLNITSASLYLNRGGLFLTSGSIINSGNDIQFNVFPSASFVLRTQQGGDAVLRANADFTNNNLPHSYFKAVSNGVSNMEIIGFGHGLNISASGVTMQGLTYPNADGTNGQVLTTNGAGTLSFTTVSGGSTDTGSLLVTASANLNTITFTKGDASTFAITVDTGSGGGGGGQTFENPTLNPYSGSLILAANTTSTASLAPYITASNNGQVNLMFLNRNLTGGVYISGSSNIFPNPNSPSTGRINYLGGSSNILLTSFTANNTQSFPTMTGSAATIGGVYPAMNGNILMGQGSWTINPSNNPGIHNYNNNILNGGNVTFNTLGNVQTTGVANTGRFDFTGNTTAGNITINSPSRSIAEINAGASGSNALSITSNTIAGTFTYHGPVSSSTHNITRNTLAGNLNLNLQSGSRGYSIFNNNINGVLTLNDNTVFAPTLGSSPGFSNNIINGTAIFNTRASSSFSVGNNNINTWTISSDADVSSITALNRLTTLNGNILGGVTGNNILYSGSASANARKQIVSNVMAGNLISASVGGDEQALQATAVLGHGLTVFGTGICNIGNVAVGGERNGSAFLGRWNDNTLPKAGTAETIFAVGTGNSGSAGITRKTGFLIDSGSNTFIEGTLNVSGSSSFTGSITATGTFTASLQE